MSVKAFHASARFGLGPAPGEIKMIESDPMGWLFAQLERPKIPAQIEDLKNDPAAKAAIMDYLKTKKMKNNQGNAKKDIKNIYIKGTGIRFLVQQKTQQPFIERLVIFWSNHFTVSIQKAAVIGYIHEFEAQAIRPHVTGRFVDMLKAVVQHPAMLIYLDNAKSFGPNAPQAKRKEKGLNENLAREILELHTLGVGGGYAQNDVIALAKIITGWTLSKPKEGVPKFAFQPGFHEPGSKTLLGKTYKENGINEGIQALEDLARHPSTAKFIATKLARHFIADDPPAAAVDKLANIYRQTDGDLKALSKALVEMKESWAEPLAKFKTPYEFALSAVRLSGIEPTPQQAIMGLESLNYRVFYASSPAGYPDVATAWSSPDAVMKRIEWAQALSKRLPPKTDPMALAMQAFGPVMNEDTRFIIAGAETGQDGLAFLLSSPEFQRR